MVSTANDGQNPASASDAAAPPPATTPNLRDAYLEHQREIRKAEDRVMQMQSLYDEEAVRTTTLRDECGLLRKEIDDNNAKLLAITEDILKTQERVRVHGLEAESYRASQAQLAHQTKLLEAGLEEAQRTRDRESERFNAILASLEASKKALVSFVARSARCDASQALFDRIQGYQSEGADARPGVANPRGPSPRRALLDALSASPVPNP